MSRRTLSASSAARVESAPPLLEETDALRVARLAARCHAPGRFRARWELPHVWQRCLRAGRASSDALA